MIKFDVFFSLRSPSLGLIIFSRRHIRRYLRLVHHLRTYISVYNSNNSSHSLSSYLSDRGKIINPGPKLIDSLFIDSELFFLSLLPTQLFLLLSGLAFILPATAIVSPSITYYHQGLQILLYSGTSTRRPRRNTSRADGSFTDIYSSQRVKREMSAKNAYRKRQRQYSETPLPCNISDIRFPSQEHLHLFLRPLVCTLPPVLFAVGIAKESRDENRSRF